MFITKRECEIWVVELENKYPFMKNLGEHEKCWKSAQEHCSPTVITGDSSHGYWKSGARGPKGLMKYQEDCHRSGVPATWNGFEQHLNSTKGVKGCRKYFLLYRTGRFNFQYTKIEYRKGDPRPLPKNQTKVPTVECNNELNGLVEYYESECRSFIVDGVYEAQVENVGMVACSTRTFPKPPSMNAQRARTLGNNERLKEYLRNGIPNKRKRHAVNYLNYHSKVLYNKVMEYLKTDEGIELLKACEINHQAATIDHVWAECLGGPNHLFNFHLMPMRDNSSFNKIHYTNPEKAAYVGPDQMALMRRLTMEAQKELPWEIIS